MHLSSKTTASGPLAVAVALAVALAASASLRAEDVLFAVDVTERSAEVVRRVDPYTGDSEVVWRGGGDLDIAVSRDLTRLYVNHLNGAGRGHKLTAVDLATGTRLATVDTPHRLRWTVPTAPTMKLSPDGRKLYLLNLHSLPDEERHAVVVFDTDFSRFLGEEVSLGECSGAQLWPLEGDGEVLVLCRGSGMIHSLKFASDGAVEKHERVQVPPTPVMPLDGPRVSRSDSEESIVQAALDPESNLLYLAKRNGLFFAFDATRLSVSAVEVTPSREGTTVNREGSALFDHRRWILSFMIRVGGDGLIATTASLDLSSLILGFPPESAKLRSLETAPPGGKYAYLTYRSGEGIRVVDAETADLVAILSAVRKPAFVIRRTRG